MHGWLRRHLWALVAALLVLIVLGWIDWWVLWSLLALLFVAATGYYLFLLGRGVWRGWKGHDPR
jgi:hypothetical protein